VKGRRISRSTGVALIVGGDLLLLVLGWVLLVSPQRATARSIARSADATQVQVQQAQVRAPAAPVQPKQPEIRTAYLYKLSKAMPMTTDMPNLLLELSQTVRAAGVQLSALTPGATDATGTTPVTMAVSGDFYSLTDLLYRLRSLVTVRDGALDVSGRLFSVKSVNFAPAGSGARLSSTIQLSTYTFGAAAAAAATPAPAPATDTSTATGETTTTDASASADVGVEQP